MKKIAVYILLIVTIGGIIGCQKEESKEVVKEPVAKQEQQKVEKVELKEETPENQNLLTGIADLSDDAIGKRPVAVMVNNVNAALPQYGIAKADIIYETVVEGDLTRLMAIYADYTQVPVVCAVRSCRYYYPAISEGFDAIYAHWGMDETKRDYVEEIDSDRFDAMKNPSGLFGRDQNRLNSGYALEHTAYFDGPQLPSVLSELGIRTDLLEDKKSTAFNFCGLNEVMTPEGKSCNHVLVNFGSATAEFTYDEKTNTYFKKINGNDQMDSRTGTQLSFTNVFILETNISVRTDSNSGHKQIDWMGGPEAVGYYISNGTVQKIHWSKENEKAYLKFYNENGEELVVNRGKSYIAMNYPNQTTFE